MFGDEPLFSETDPAMSFLFTAPLSTVPRPVFRVLMLAVALVVATGCMQIENTVTIRPDGSGTISERVVISSQMSMMMESMASMDSSADESGQMFSEENVRDRDPYPGTQLDGVTMIDDMSGRGYESVYTFSDIREVAFRPSSPAEVMPEDAQSGGKMKIGNSGSEMLNELDMEFTPGSPATLLVRIPRDATADESDVEMEREMDMEDGGDGPDMSDPQQLRMLRMMFRDARFRVAVNVEGDIVETNATHRSGNTVTLFDFNFGEMVQDTSALRQFMEFSEKENADPSEISDLPGVTVENQKEVTIRFE
jgi:hypothetical protein